MNRTMLIHSGILIAIGVILWVGASAVVSLSESDVLIFAALIYGFAGVYISIRDRNRKAIIIFTSIFYAGLINFLLENYMFYFSHKILLPTILVIAGTALILFFIENPRVFSFLIGGLILLTAAFLIVVIWKKEMIIELADTYSEFIFGQWYLITLALGIILWRKAERRPTE